MENIMVIGIAGPTSSGKSLLAHTIVEEPDSKQVTIIAEDSYYLKKKLISCCAVSGPSEPCTAFS